MMAAFEAIGRDIAFRGDTLCWSKHREFLKLVVLWQIARAFVPAFFDEDTRKVMPARNMRPTDTSVAAE